MCIGICICIFDCAIPEYWHRIEIDGNRKTLIYPNEIFLFDVLHILTNSLPQKTLHLFTTVLLWYVQNSVVIWLWRMELSRLIFPSKREWNILMKHTPATMCEIFSCEFDEYFLFHEDLEIFRLVCSKYRFLYNSIYLSHLSSFD